MFLLVLYLGLVYLAASVPFGLLVPLALGASEDPRHVGSGNIGATNVLRLFGKRVAGAVLLADVLKGLVPVLVAWAFFPPRLATVAAGLAGITAFLGHCFPVYLGLRGGKGVATGAGAMLGLTPVATFVAAAVWAVLLWATGRSSVASLGAAMVLIGLVAWLAPHMLAVAGVLAVLVAVLHGANLRRLIAGEEPALDLSVRREAEDVDAVALLHRSPAGTPVDRPAGERSEP